MSDTTGQNNGTAASVGRALDRLRGRAGAQGAAAHDAGGLEALSAQREELAAKVAELTWDLGGLTYEMAIRDHFRLDVLVRRAAVLQEVDAELGEVERLLAAAEEGVTGQCRSCGAVHSRGAVYCWKCGQPLMLQAQSSLVPSAVPVNAPAASGGAG
jgi:hypothetical protein